MKKTFVIMAALLVLTSARGNSSDKNKGGKGPKLSENLKKISCDQIEQLSTCTVSQFPKKMAAPGCLGEVSQGANCSTEQRVGSCVLEVQWENYSYTTEVNYYAPLYTTEIVRSACLGEFRE